MDESKDPLKTRILNSADKHRLQGTYTNTPFMLIDATEKMVVDRLCAGVELPLRVDEVLVVSGPNTHKNMKAGQWYYTHDQLKVAIAASRVKTLEEAAVLMEEQDTQAPKYNARVIRALKGVNHE